MEIFKGGEKHSIKSQLCRTKLQMLGSIGLDFYFLDILVGLKLHYTLIVWQVVFLVT